MSAITRRRLLHCAAATALATSCASLGGTSARESISGAKGEDRWRLATRLADSIPLPQIPDAKLDITTLGAKSGAPARGAIQAAIDRLAVRGGGRVVVPAGFWPVDGSLRLASRIDLHVADGAHVQFSGNAQNYLPVVKTRWEGTEVWTYSPMIFGNELEQVAITGKGTIDGQGEKNFLPWRDRQKADQNALRQMGIDGVPVDDRVFGKDHWLRPHFVQFRECRRVLIDGPKFVDSPFWVNHLLYCDQAIIRNIRVVSRHINSDGVDVDSSKDVLIEHCQFDVGDDGVAIKSGRDQDGWRVNRPSKNVVVRNCEYLGSTGGALAIGSEMSGGVHDIYVEGFTMNKVHHALYFKSNLDRGGKIERVNIRHIRVGEADSLLIFTNDYHSYRGGNFPARFEKVLVEQVDCDRARIGISVIGHARAPVRDVIVRNTTIGAATTPLQIRHVKGLLFENVHINGALITAPSESDSASFEAGLRH